MANDLVRFEVQDRWGMIAADEVASLQRAMRKLSRTYANRVRAAAQANLHHVTGWTAANIRIRVRNRRGVLTFTVSPDPRHAWYGYCIENGHIAGQVRNRRHVRRTAQQIADLKEFGKWVPAKPFMGPASRELTNFSEAVEDELKAQYWGKHARGEPR